METIIVTVAILEENNKFLIISPGESLEEYSYEWEFPGGKLFPGEEPETGLLRIIKEKLGMEITTLDIFKVASQIINNKQFVFLAYLCVRNFGEPQALNCKEFCWVTIDELRSGKYDFSSSDKKIINKISIFSGCGPSLLL